MNTPAYLIIQINELTALLEARYPELYQFIDEQPLTISSDTVALLDEESLSNYLESLNQLLKNHITTHDQKG